MFFICLFVKMLHPCCHLIPTDLAAKFIAICDLIFGLIGMFWLIYMLDGYALDKVQENDESMSVSTQKHRILPLLAALQTNVSEDIFKSITEPTVTETERFSTLHITSEEIRIDGEIGNSALSGLYTVMNLTLFALLLNAVNTRNIFKLKVWFLVRSATILLKCLVNLSFFISGFQVYSQIPHIIFTTLHLYGLWVVAALISEIKREDSIVLSPANHAINKEFSNNLH